MKEQLTVTLAAARHFAQHIMAFIQTVLCPQPSFTRPNMEAITTAMTIHWYRIYIIKSREFNFEHTFREYRLHPFYYFKCMNMKFFANWIAIQGWNFMRQIKRILLILWRSSTIERPIFNALFSPIVRESDENDCGQCGIDWWRWRANRDKMSTRNENGFHIHGMENSTPVRKKQETSLQTGPC